MSGGQQQEATTRRRNTSRRRDEMTAWLFLAPGLIAFTVFVMLPAVGALLLSFSDWRLFDEPTFVGLKHITRLFTDEAMWKSLGITVVFLALGVVPTVVLGFLLAVVASSTLRGVGGLRILYFLPMVASSAITSVLWANLYQARHGFFAQILAVFGIEGPAWLSDPGLVRPALVVVMIWSALPIVVILYVAAIQKVPDDIYAAAAIDGAGKWRQLWSMTWPMTLPTTAVLLVLQLITWLAAPLEYALIMTDGGPLGESTTLGLYAYKTAFVRRDMGYASALALFQLVLIAVVFAIVSGLNKLRRRTR